MKIIKISLTALVLSVGFVSCKKDVDVTPQIVTPVPAPTPTSNQSLITGVWVGQSLSTSRSAPVYFSIEMQAGGNLHLLSQTNQVVGTGSWSLNDTVLNASYTVTATGIIYSLVGDLDPAATPAYLHGKWQYSNNYEDSGYWALEKAN